MTQIPIKPDEKEALDEPEKSETNAKTDAEGSGAKAESDAEDAKQEQTVPSDTCANCGRVGGYKKSPDCINCARCDNAIMAENLQDKQEEK